jgi:hypothetical protein
MKSSEKSRIHVLAIALERHQDAAIAPVEYAGNDVRAFLEAWQALGAQPADCIRLVDESATKEAIKSSVKALLRSVGVNDTVVLFFVGHGVASDGVSQLITFDSQTGDLVRTSLSMTSLLEPLERIKCERRLVFIDARREGLASDNAENFAEAELLHFAENADQGVAFTSCRPAESSWSSNTLQHGIWSHAMIAALSGGAKSAVDEHGCITCDSLGDYLATGVPQLLRTTRSGDECQTPMYFTNAGDEFVIADLTTVRAGRGAETDALGSALKDASLRGEKLGHVRRLSGFRKRHHVPEEHFDAADSFVKRIGHEEVKRQADEIHERARATFKYRRRSLSYVCEDGAASIKTPDFDVNLSIAQDPDDASGYVLTTEVGVIRRAAVVMEEGFSDVFSPYCDTVFIEFERPLDLADKIDQIEDLPQLEPHLHAAADGTSFTLQLPQPTICIHVSATRMTLSLAGSKNLRALLSRVQGALSVLSDSGLALLGSNSGADD